MKKYAVYPGIILSKENGDEQYIGAAQLMHSYGVSPQECIIITADVRPLVQLPRGMTRLFPQQDGNYSISSTKPTASPVS